MNENTYIAKKTIYGFDLLKIILAVFIISGHTALFEEYSNLAHIREVLSSIAVPTFMAISAYLFFRKVYNVSKDDDSKPILIKTLKRLGLLFFSWYILMLPMAYIKFFSVATLKETIFALLFSCTFKGYWFIKALIINTCFFYLFRKSKALVVLTFFAWIVYLFFSYNYVFHFIDFPYHPYYSFYYNMGYYSIGVLFAKYGKSFYYTRANELLLIASFILVFLLGFIEELNPLYRIFSIPLLFMLFYQLDLAPKPYYKTMRDMSIILYMVQFVLIWLYNGSCELWFKQNSVFFVILQHSITRFLIVTMITISIAWLILKYEKHPKFSFLHYLH